MKPTKASILKHLKSSFSNQTGTLEVNGLTITIEQDLYPESPREWDNELCKIVGTSNLLSSDEYASDQLEVHLNEYLSKEFQKRHPKAAQLNYGIEDETLPCFCCNADQSISTDSDCSRCNDGWITNPFYTESDDLLDKVSKYSVMGGNDLYVATVYSYSHSGVCHSLTPYSCRFDSGIGGFMFAEKSVFKRCFPELSDAELEKRWMKTAEQDLNTLNAYLGGEVYQYHINGANDDSEVCSGYYGDLNSNGIFEEITKDVYRYSNERNRYRIQRLKAMIKARCNLSVRQSFLSEHLVFAS